MTSRRRRTLAVEECAETSRLRGASKTKTGGSREKWSKVRPSEARRLVSVRGGSVEGAGARYRPRSRYRAEKLQSLEENGGAEAEKKALSGADQDQG